MTFKRALYPIAVVATGINVAGGALAAIAAEPLHAAVHVALALAFGVWALRLRKVRAAEVPHSRVEVLEDEVTNLQRQLTEKQEGLDFVEQLLKNRPAAQPVEPHPPPAERGSATSPRVPNQDSEPENRG
jgi:hypothetical protein